MITHGELLRDLRAALDSPEAERDPLGLLLSWAQIATGRVDPDRARYGLVEERPMDADERRQWAIDMCRDLGPISSSDLSEVCSCSQEAARLTLRDLVKEGRLVRRGNWRTARYRLPNDGT